MPKISAPVPYTLYSPTPYGRPTPSRACTPAKPECAPEGAKARAPKAITLPIHLMEVALQAGRPWSTKDVRAISQTCRALNDVMAQMQPESYRLAHHMTLVKAFRTPQFRFHNVRAQQVLKCFDALELLEETGVAPKHRVCDPTAIPLQRLRNIIAAACRAQAIYLGSETASAAPWLRLLQAGLQADTLATVDLGEATLPWGDLERFCGSFASMARLKQLVLPKKLRLGGAQGPRRPSLCFGPLKQLSRLAWRTHQKIPYERLDLGANQHLKHLVMDFMAPQCDLALEGWEYDDFTQRVTLTLPPAPLETLRLQGIALSPKTAQHLNHAPWQDSLTSLQLWVTDCCPFIQIDLCAYKALSRVSIKYNATRFGQLRLPSQKLEVLHLHGPASAILLQGLRAPGAARLRELNLDCPLEGGSRPRSIPWASLPSLKVLTCQSDNATGNGLSLALLNIPQDNQLERLRLSRSYTAQTWAVEHEALQGLNMPQLRTLDLTYVTSHNAPFFAQVLESLDEALSRRERWPVIDELVLPNHYEGVPPLRATMAKLAARHKLRLTFGPRATDF